MNCHKVETYWFCTVIQYFSLANHCHYVILLYVAYNMFLTAPTNLSKWVMLINIIHFDMLVGTVHELMCVSKSALARVMIYMCNIHSSTVDITMWLQHLTLIPQLCIVAWIHTALARPTSVTNSAFLLATPIDRAYYNIATHVLSAHAHNWPSIRR